MNWYVLHARPRNEKSVMEVIDSFEKINNLKVSYTIGSCKDGDVEKIYSDNSKINQELRPFPLMSFESALKTSWEWEKNKTSNHKA